MTIFEDIDKLSNSLEKEDYCGDESMLSVLRRIKKQALKYENFRQEFISIFKSYNESDWDLDMIELYNDLKDIQVRYVPKSTILLSEARNYVASACSYVSSKKKAECLLYKIDKELEQ